MSETLFDIENIKNGAFQNYDWWQSEQKVWIVFVLNF